MWDKIEALVDKHWWLPLVGIVLFVLLVGVVVDATPDYAHGLVFVSFWFCCTIGAGLVVAAFEYRFWAIVIGSTLTLSCLVYLACVGVPSVPDKETIQSIARYGGVVTGILNVLALAAGYYCTHGRL